MLKDWANTDDLLSKQQGWRHSVTIFT